MNAVAQAEAVLAAAQTRDPIFDLTPVELLLGIIVVFVICAVVGWAWRTFKP